MHDVSTAPDISRLEIPTDRWTEPFWQGAAEHRLLLPRCGACATYRWPPGPFCPVCRSQEVDWAEAGPARLYSFTIILPKPGADGGTPWPTVPGLVAFPRSGGVRIMAAIVDSPIAATRIDVPLRLGWVRLGELNVPVFTVADEGG